MKHTYKICNLFAITIVLLISLSCSDDEPEDVIPEEGSFDLFVTSSKTNTVNRYNGDTGEFIEVFIPSTAGLIGPQEVLFDFEGNLLVSAIGNNAVRKYDALTGSFLGDFTNGYSLVGPTKMKFGPDSFLYVSQWSDGQSSVVQFDGKSGAFIKEMTADHNTTMGQEFKDGELYVAVFGDGQDGRVLRYDLEGNLLGVFIGSNVVNGPVNLRFDGDELLVEDWSDGAIKRYSASTGSFIGSFVSGLGNVEGSTFGPDGFLYACDWARNSVKKYDPVSGSFIETFTSGGILDTPNSLIFRER